MGNGCGGSNGGRMRFDPEASWGANAGLGVARKALEDIKVCIHGSPLYRHMLVHSAFRF